MFDVNIEGPSTRRRSARTRGGPVTISEPKVSPKKGRGKRGRPAKRSSESEERIVEEDQENSVEVESANQVMYQSDDENTEAVAAPANGVEGGYENEGTHSQLTLNNDQFCI